MQTGQMEVGEVEEFYVIDNQVSFGIG